MVAIDRSSSGRPSIDIGIPPSPMLLTSVSPILRVLFVAAISSFSVLRSWFLAGHQQFNCPVPTFPRRYSVFQQEKLITPSTSATESAPLRAGRAGWTGPSLGWERTRRRTDRLMTYQPCRYAQRWPELFEPLDDAQKQRISDALANGRLEGWEPEREDVADLIDRELGRIDRSEYVRRTMARAERAQEGRAGRP
jgi:hypothetical protein